MTSDLLKDPNKNNRRQEMYGDVFCKSAMKTAY